MPKGFEADPAPASRLSQAYALARFVAACQSRSDFPIHFQGGMFIPGNESMAIPRDPRMDRNNITPDFCFHGTHYWWQNVRLIYHPLLAQGDNTDFCRFLDFYLGQQPLFERLAADHGKTGGLTMGETITLYGLPTQKTREAKSSAYTDNIWQQPLELACMMLDYADYSSDADSLKNRIVPFCLQTLRFFDTRFGRDDRGRLLISPSHAIETYWENVANDMPTVAGLHALTQRLLALPKAALSPLDRTYVERLSKILPDLPLRHIDQITLLDHAQRYEDKRHNFEAPDLYAVFPFRLYGLGREDIAFAQESFARMKNPLHHCWVQTGLFAARLGLVDEARRDLCARAELFIPGNRFPGFFNSPFDSPPDLDGAGNLQTLLQEMLLQADPYSGKLHLLPAWPRKWDVDFKLHAPHQTVVEARFRDGRLDHLVVTPESRRRDLVLPPDLTPPTE
jgi:hypothetical protein